MWLARSAAILLLAACASTAPAAAPAPAPAPAADAAVGLVLRPPQPTPLLAAGAHHTCASTSDGGLECWGAGTAGQLGDGALRSRGRAVRVLFVRDPVLLAAGDAHTCAQDARGTLYCWGKVLRDEGTTGFPLRIARGPFVALAADAGITCGLAPSGVIECWGEGEGSRTEAPATLAVGDRLCTNDTCFAIELGGARALRAGSEDGPPPPADLGPVDAQVSGRAHACARTRGEIRCWGDDAHGQRGQGTELPRAGHWEPVPGLTDATGLAASWDRVCAARRSGQVVCFGATFDDETSEEGPVTLQPVPAGVDAAVSIATDGSGGTMCAVLRDGGAVCWDPTMIGEDGEPPSRIRGIAGAVAIGVGDGIACTANRAGQVTCWVPDDPDRAARRVQGLPVVRDMQVVGYRGCGIDTKQRLWCWDADRFRASQPGFARRTCRGGPRYLEAHQGEIADACSQTREAPLSGVRSLVLSGETESMALFHALLGNAGVFAYADTETGESMAAPKPSGAPPATPHDFVEPFPLPVHTERLVGDSAAGCAITAARSVHCWGGPFGPVPMPAELPPPSAVATSHHLMCALIEGGQVRCQLISTAE